VNISLARRDGAAVRRLFGAQGLLWPAFTAAFVAAALLQILCSKAVDPDYWWHLAAGRWMLDHGRIATVDPFSFTHGGQNWVAHEWLGELLIALGDRAGGYAFNILLTTAILGAGLFLLWRAARLLGASRRTATVAVATCVFYLAVEVAIRPQVWAFALIMAIIHELVAHDRGARRRLWHLPLLFVALINLNLLALMAGLVLALYALHRAIEWLRATGEARALAYQQARHVLLVGLLCLVALCINPRGPALLTFAFSYMNPQALRLRAIQEWRPLAFGGLGATLYLLGALLVVFTLWAMARRRVLWPGVLVLVFALLAARAVRYVPLFGIALAVGYAAMAVEFRFGCAPEDKTGRSPRLALLTLLAGLTVGAGMVHLSGAEFARAPDATAGGYPVAATAWLRANLPDARLFADYGWGGYLDDALYPASNVFIDGREEMYGDAIFGAYLNTEAAVPGWQATLTTWRVDAVVTAPGGALAAALAADPSWRERFSDTAAIIYTPVGVS
jgi:hypothetical protein